MTPPDPAETRAAGEQSIAKSEAQIAKDLPGLKANLDKAGWPDNKKTSFLDRLLGKGNH